jgi:hypothetical protein
LAANPLLPPPGSYNPAGRAVPDVAAVGHLFYRTQNGLPKYTDGTSASTPVWAGIIALANAARAAAGLPPVGWVNPLLYALASNFSGPVNAGSPLFHDVTQGNNTCQRRGQCLPCTGYGAAPGYDLVTGLGTPNIGRVIEAMVASRYIPPPPPPFSPLPPPPGPKPREPLPGLIAGVVVAAVALAGAAAALAFVRRRNSVAQAAGAEGGPVLGGLAAGDVASPANRHASLLAAAAAVRFSGVRASGRLGGGAQREGQASETAGRPLLSGISVNGEPGLEDSVL